MRWNLALALLAVTAIPFGCSKKAVSDSEENSNANQRGGVAIVDLDEVAKRIGRQQEMVDLVKKRQDEINLHLSTMQTSYVEKVKAEEAKYGEKPTDAQIKLLSGFKRKEAIELNQKQRKAQYELQQHSARLIQNFRSRVAPIAEQIARDKGFDIVIPKDKRLLVAVNPAADITEQVIEKLLKEKSGGTPQTAAGPAPEKN